MSEPLTLSLSVGESGSAFDLKITYLGGAAMNYAGGQAGAVALRFEYGGQTEDTSIMQRRWGTDREVFGFTYQVTNPPELSPPVVHLRVSPRDGA